VSGLTYTLLGDGTSDRLLEYPIRWALASMGVGIELGQWADLRHARPRPSTLTERARIALELYPAQLLLVHRDSEREPLDVRLAEIRTAVASVTDRYVAVVPVRMTEAWLLHDEEAIRRASGNPNGTVVLALPAVTQVEAAPDPKSVLYEALLNASELSGRRRENAKRSFLKCVRARLNLSGISHPSRSYQRSKLSV
jgi:hypothetical protein